LVVCQVFRLTQTCLFQFCLLFARCLQAVNRQQEFPNIKHYSAKVKQNVKIKKLSKIFSIY